MSASLHGKKMRLEQLKLYKGSMLDHSSSTPKDQEKMTIKFNKGYTFLTVCASDDIEEVERLLEESVDINTANIDGLTALHQACLNERMNVVKVLVEHSADVNICDNDGWTPLHAACSTDNIEIARYLVNNGSKLDAVSFDGELPVDVTESETMVHFISDNMAKIGVDSERARSQEEKTMREDAEHWLSTGSYDNRIVHPLTCASPLLVAASRGYVDVMQILLKAGANINAQDYDGWTPMHAAAHWGHKEACQLLVNNRCDLGMPDNSGLLAQDVADPELGNLIEELKAKQVKMDSDQILRRQNLTSRRRSRRSSVSRLSFDQKQTMVQKSRGEERATMVMMLAKRNSRTNLGEGNVCVFDVEEKEEEMAEEDEGSARGAEYYEIMQNDISIENGESENSANTEEKPESEVRGKDESILCNADEESIPEINSVLEGVKKSEQETVEAESLARESSTEIFEHLNRINDRKTSVDINRNLEIEVRPGAVVSEAEPPEVSTDASLHSLIPSSGSFLSSATSAALRALANSHRWSMDDPKKDEENENARKSRVMQLRKEKLEKRRSTQGVSKEDIARAGASLQAADCIEEEPDDQIPSDLETKEVNREETGRHSVLAAKEELPHTPSISNRNQNITLTLYRKSAPQESTIPLEEDDINTKAAALAQARRKGRLSGRQMRQENFEETTPEKETQGNISASDQNETNSIDKNQIAAELSDRLSSNISANSSLSLSTLQLPSSPADISHNSSPLEKDNIDYKKVYEKERSLNEQLSLQNKQLQQQLNGAMLQIEHVQEVNRNITKEKMDLERRISELEAEFQVHFNEC